MKELRLPADTKHIEEAMDFVIASVKEKSSNKREIVQATLISEESIMSIITNASEGTEMTLRIAKGMNILSLGAPGIPGSGLICLSVLLGQIGVPIEALSLMIGIDALMGMFRTTINVTGDVAISLIVAKTENMLDIEKFKS